MWVSVSSASGWHLKKKSRQIKNERQEKKAAGAHKHSVRGDAGAKRRMLLPRGETTGRGCQTEKVGHLKQGRLLT